MNRFYKTPIFCSKSFIALVSITACILFLSRCVAGDKEQTASAAKETFETFAGSQVCASCHKDVYENHLRTAHHLTSVPATEQNILGSFAEGRNKFAFGTGTSIIMQKTDSGFYQVQYTAGTVVKTAKFDMVIGSGRKGQSYLSWVKDSALAQLPITYFSPAGQWSNSPGYRPHHPAFNRPITSRCLECHSTFFQTATADGQKQERFSRNRIILGVECEKCHGPAAQHVAFHQANKSNEAKFIVNPGKLPRERVLDLCALCHGGALQKTKPSFSFAPGDTLSNYFSLQAAMLNADNIDVHGNQAGLLYLSKCFTQSNLTCLNCHNTHEPEADKLPIFSQRCATCHAEGHEKTCKLTATIGPAIQQNCIDCHMPKQPSHAVAVYLQGADAPTPALLRTHFIKVYPDETEKMMRLLMKRNTR